MSPLVVAALSLAATAVGLLFTEVAAAHGGDNPCPCGWEPYTAADLEALQTSLALAPSRLAPLIFGKFRSRATPEDRPAYAVGRLPHATSASNRAGALAPRETRGDEERRAPRPLHSAARHDDPKDRQTHREPFAGEAEQASPVTRASANVARA